MLCSHRFFCLPLRLSPWTVPCRIVLASPDDRVTCPYHVSLRLFTRSQEVFIRPDGVSNSGFHFLIGYVISVWDTEKFAETSHLQCLYPPFNVCCYGPRVTCIRPGNASVWSWSWWRCSCRSRWLLVWSLQLWSGNWHTLKWNKNKLQPRLKQVLQLWRQLSYWEMNTVTAAPPHVSHVCCLLMGSSTCLSRSINLLLTVKSVGLQSLWNFQFD